MCHSLCKNVPLCKSLLHNTDLNRINNSYSKVDNPGRNQELAGAGIEPQSRSVPDAATPIFGPLVAKFFSSFLLS